MLGDAHSSAGIGGQKSDGIGGWSVRRMRRHYPRAVACYILARASCDPRERVRGRTTKIRIRLLVPVLFAMLLLPVAAVAQSNNQTVFSNSSSTSVGSANAVYVFVTTTVGPATIFINDRGLCTLEGPPFPSCTFSGGTGAPDSPFDYSCTGSGPPIANCTSGTPFTLAGGQVDIDVDTHTVTTGAVPAAASVPLNPWVPIGSALGVALLAVGWQLRRRRT